MRYEALHVRVEDAGNVVKFFVEQRESYVVLRALDSKGFRWDIFRICPDGTIIAVCGVPKELGLKLDSNRETRVYSETEQQFLSLMRG